MGKWAKYSIFDSSGRLVLTFRGQKVKGIKPAVGRTIGFRPLSDAVSTTTIDVQVECDCPEDHEEHLQ